jgi:hypothetical protein
MPKRHIPIIIPANIEPAIGNSPFKIALFFIIFSIFISVLLKKLPFGSIHIY